MAMTRIVPRGKGACEGVVRRERTVRSSGTKQMANKGMRQSGHRWHPAYRYMREGTAMEASRSSTKGTSA